MRPVEWPQEIGLMGNLDERIRNALKVDMVVDITTTGRKTGLPRRIEIWAHWLGGEIVITAMPGRRSWYANLVANPEFTLHLKDDVHADLRAVARPVREKAERRAVLTKVKRTSRFGQRRTMDVERWVNGSCLIAASLAG